MVLILMVEEEVRRVWTMLLLIGVAVEVYDRLLCTGGSWVSKSSDSEML